MPQQIHKIIDSTSELGEWELRQGWCVAIPVTIAEGKSLITQLYKDNNTQDYSVKAWLSKDKGGSSLGLFDDSVDDGRLNLLDEAIYKCAYYSTECPVDNKIMYKMKIEAGDYYINFLNLVNSVNVVKGTIEIV